MLRLALTHIRDRQAADDLVQDTWLAALEGVDGFEARSSFRTSFFAILLNKARAPRVTGARSRLPPSPGASSPEIERIYREGVTALVARARADVPSVSLAS